MHVRISPLLPIAFLVIWAITCVCTFLFATTSVVLDFAYFVFAIVTVLLALSAIALFRAAPAGSRCARYAVGSLGMLVSVSLIYLFFGLSPLVLWRA